MLNIIWIAFFVSAFLMALYRALILGDGGVWTELVNSVFVSSKAAFSIALNLTGILCFWLGLLKIAEASGITGLLSKALYPLFRRIMPGVPAESPALSSMIMNIAANMLGLDNAATPMGLKAMEQLQQLNPKKDTASDAQILFMVINTSAVTLIPITILMYRAELGSVNPSAVFMPILFATSLSTLSGFLAVAWVQKLNIFNRVVLGWLLGFAVFIGAVVWHFQSLPPAERLQTSAAWGNFILFAFIVSFITAGLIRRINVYELLFRELKKGLTSRFGLFPIWLPCWLP